MRKTKEIDIDFIKEQYPKFYELALGDGESIKEQLLIASLFLMSYETFKDYVMDSFQDLFNDGYQFNKDNKLVPILGERYNENCSKFSAGEKTEKHFMAACKWFESVGAFEKEDIEIIRLIKEIRNDLAHELFARIGSDEKPSLEKDFINIPINLLFKISKWWIREIEVDVMPENFEKFTEQEMSEATSMQVELLFSLKEKIFVSKTNLT